MFTGEYRHSVDAKGRMAVPARFRGQLAGGAFVTRWMDACLALFPRAAWEAFAEKVAGLPATDADARTFQRFFFSSTFETGIDGQGRVLLPASLREWAGLENEVAVVGARDHIELWEPRRWDEYSASMNAPEVLNEHLQGLGI